MCVYESSQVQFTYFSSFLADTDIILFSAVKEEVNSLRTRFNFGAALDLDLLGIEVDDKTLIPGLAVASSRAISLAGITSLRTLFLSSC